MLNNDVLRLGFLDLREPSRFEVTAPATPDTEFELSHNLGRVPSGYFVASQNGAGSLYDSGTAWTSKKIYFKSSVQDTVYIVYFI